MHTTMGVLMADINANHNGLYQVLLDENTYKSCRFGAQPTAAGHQFRLKSQGAGRGGGGRKTLKRHGLDSHTKDVGAMQVCGA